MFEVGHGGFCIPKEATTLGDKFQSMANGFNALGLTCEVFETTNPTRTGIVFDPLVTKTGKNTSLIIYNPFPSSTVIDGGYYKECSFGVRKENAGTTEYLTQSVKCQWFMGSSSGGGRLEVHIKGADCYYVVDYMKSTNAVFFGFTENSSDDYTLKKVGMPLGLCICENPEDEADIWPCVVFYNELSGSTTSVYDWSGKNAFRSWTWGWVDTTVIAPIHTNKGIVRGVKMLDASGSRPCWGMYQRGFTADPWSKSLFLEGKSYWLRTGNLSPTYDNDTSDIIIEDILD